MYRLLFEKKGNAVWISHLDLMRLFQRAFKRADFRLTHTQGYNPRPSVSIALPLSVGVESDCELLDFEIENEGVSWDEIRESLNRTLINGVAVKSVYSNGKKLKELAFLQYSLMLTYDFGVPEGSAEEIRKLFDREVLLVEKKSKNGVTEQDIKPMLQSLSVSVQGQSVFLDGVVCCQNPSLNPMQLVAAIDRYLPELKPNFAQCRRVEIFDKNHEVFR